MFTRWFGRDTLPKKPKIAKFSFENLKILHNKLAQNPRINNNNEKEIIEVIRTLAELLVMSPSCSFFVSSLAPPCCHSRVIM